MTAMPVSVGIGEREITPRHPVPLAGFASRQNKPYTDIDRSLWVRAWWIGTERDFALLVVADILWWAPERQLGFRQRIADRWRVPVSRILLHATHTHSAPQTSDVFTESVGSPSSEWVEMFEEASLRAIADSHQSIAPSILTLHKGSTDIGYNRRISRDDPDAVPEATGLVDDQLTVIRCTSPDGSPRGLLFHLACHPTITDAPHVSSEYPGIACENLRGEFGMVSMLQGTCGDVNPRVTRNQTRRDVGDDVVAGVAAELVTDIRSTLSNEGVSIAIEEIRNAEVKVDCRSTSVASEEAISNGIKHGGLRDEWARALRRYPHRNTPSQTMTLYRLDLGSDLQFVTFDAEVVTAYGLYAREIGQTSALPLGYTNGMVGYIVTDEQLANGGYEPDESTVYFALPSPFAPGLEHSVRTGIHQLISQGE